MLDVVLATAIWILPTFFLHNLLHEGAHWAVAKAYGIRSKIRLLPMYVKAEGRLIWAAVIFEDSASLHNPKITANIAVAPVLIELAWFIGAAIMLEQVKDVAPAWALAIARVEVFAPLIDLTTWMLGVWTKNPYDDADCVLQGWTIPRWFAYSASLLIMLPLYLIAYMILRG